MSGVTNSGNDRMMRGGVLVSSRSSASSARKIVRRKPTEDRSSVALIPPDFPGFRFPPSVVADWEWCTKATEGRFLVEACLTDCLAVHGQHMPPALRAPAQGLAWAAELHPVQVTRPSGGPLDRNRFEVKELSPMRLRGAVVVDRNMAEFALGILLKDARAAIMAARVRATVKGGYV